MKTWWYLTQIIRRNRGAFAVAVTFGIAYFGLPLAVGLATQAFFDALSGRATAGWNAWTVLTLLLLLQLTRSAVLAGFEVAFVRFRYAGSTLLRANLLQGILHGPGARPLPGGSGETLSRFRDDAEAIVMDTLDGWIDLVGRALFALMAFVVMARINLPLTLAVAAMLLVTVPIILLAGGRIATYGRLNHEAIGRVTGFLTEMFGAIQAIKAAGATGPVVAHFERLGERRRQAALRDQLWQSVVNALDANIVTFGTGLVLLVAGQAMRSGEFTVGDFSLFVVYLTDLLWFPDEIARVISGYFQAGVWLGRLAHPLEGRDPRTLVARLPPRILSERAGSGVAGLDQASHPSAHAAACPSAASLPLLEARGLSYCYPASGRGIHQLSLRLDPGSFVVITGRVGAGKTTLLQVLLGLLERDAGEILWKGASVVDPGAFFGPPRTSYLPQTPRLFSETLRANLQEGWIADEGGLARAARRAVLDADLAGFVEGWETLIGPRGARLSGGQIQRTAAARAFLRAPELLVLDDLSSALDLPTEELLWERLAEWRREVPDLTILAVSHRSPALRRADQIIQLEEGGIVERLDG